METGSNDWKAYCPRTNVFWLFYLFRTMAADRIVRDCPDEDVLDQLDLLTDILIKSRSAREAVSRILSTPRVCC